MRNGWYNCMEW